MPDRPITAGERFADVGSFGQRGWRRPEPVAHAGFPAHRLERRASRPSSGTPPRSTASSPRPGTVIQGGLVTAILDSAMGGACWTVLDHDEVFLTADLRVEFFRPTRPGTLRAIGKVVRRTSRVVFCAAELFDAEAPPSPPAAAPRSSCRPDRSVSAARSVGPDAAAARRPRSTSAPDCPPVAAGRSAAARQRRRPPAVGPAAAPAVSVPPPRRSPSRRPVGLHRSTSRCGTPGPAPPGR